MKNHMHTVLVVEDDMFLANAYKLAFEQSNLSVDVLYDGLAASEWLSDHTPDLIILDLLMPKKGGFELLEDMHRNERLKNIPVIVASNLGEEQDIERAKKLGAVNYIVKSQTAIGDVIAAVTHALKSSN